MVGCQRSGTSPAMEGVIMGLVSDKGDKKVAENDQWILWITDMTKIYQKDLDEYANNGFTLRGKYLVVFAENKLDGTRVYLAMDNRTGRPRIDWPDFSTFEFKKQLLLMDEKEACDIVNIAEEIQKEQDKGE